MMLPRLWTERRLVAALSLAATYVFFLEYLPPIERFELFGDISGYHYPLLQYAFQSLKEGRLPEWDPTIYCGLPFAGNTQAGLFYPANWLLFAASWHRHHLSYKMLEGLLLLHFWLAFVLCTLWFRDTCRWASIACVSSIARRAYAGERSYRWSPWPRSSTPACPGGRGGRQRGPSPSAPPRRRIRSDPTRGGWAGCPCSGLPA